MNKENSKENLAFDQENEKMESDYQKLIREKLEKNGYDGENRSSLVVSVKKSSEESMDFEETESVMWRKVIIEIGSYFIKCINSFH